MPPQASAESFFRLLPPDDSEALARPFSAARCVGQFSAASESGWHSGASTTGSGEDDVDSSGFDELEFGKRLSLNSCSGFCVKNTFVHIPDEEYGSDTDEEPGAAIALRRRAFT